MDVAGGERQTQHADTREGALDMGGIGAALFDLFPTSGAISHTEVTPEGRTRLIVGDTTLELLADGTPYSVKTADVSATVIRWQGVK